MQSIADTKSLCCFYVLKRVILIHTTHNEAESSPLSLLRGARAISGEDDAEECRIAHESHELSQLKQEPITPLGLGGHEELSLRLRPLMLEILDFSTS